MLSILRSMAKFDSKQGNVLPKLLYSDVNSKAVTLVVNMKRFIYVNTSIYPDGLMRGSVFRGVLL